MKQYNSNNYTYHGGAVTVTSSLLDDDVYTSATPTPSMMAEETELKEEEVEEKYNESVVNETERNAPSSLLLPPPQSLYQHYDTRSRRQEQKQQRQQQQPPPRIIQTSCLTINPSDLDRPYDLTPLGQDGVSANGGGESTTTLAAPVAAAPVAAPNVNTTIDPWEASETKEESPRDSEIYTEGFDFTNQHDDDEYNDEEEELEIEDFEYAGAVSRNKGSSEQRSTFLLPNDIHPNMEHKEDDIAQLRLLAGKLSAEWRAPDFMAPALARRIRDFQFAQEKRRKRYGDERPWGILGLYDHLSAIRTDVEWAEDAAIRRSNGQPYLSWIEFDEKKKSGANRPYFTYALLIVCTIVMITAIGVNGWTVEPLATNPMIGPSVETLIKLGAKDTTLIVNENEGWRLLTTTVLHAGLVHYFINIIALWFVGAAVETSHGWMAAMIIFFTSAVGGTVISAICLPDYVTVGASGGIFGFIGACLADIIMNWKLLFCDFVTDGKKHQHALIVIALFFDIILNSIIGLTPYVDNFTHLGGMMYGFLCGLSTIQRLSSDFFGMEESWTTQLKHFVVRFCGLILSCLALITTLIILFHSDGVTTPCPQCKWLSCVPFPPWAHGDNKWWYCDGCNRVTAQIITQPYLHLEIDCPGGDSANVTLSSDKNDRNKLESKLPSYCRQYCLGSDHTKN